MKTISIPKNTTFLSLALNNTLPKNCIFDKGKVGAGGTTIALTNSESYIVCVPYLSLIENKISQSKTDSIYPYEILAVTGDTPMKLIKEYMATHPVKKVMVTYNSLKKLRKYASQCSLLIDEYHLLFSQYIFRNEAVVDVLNLYKEFKSFTFMTATVLEDEFVLEELKGVEKVVAEWQDVLEVTVKPVQSLNGVTASAINTIKRFLNGEIDGNAYIFVNSLEFIKTLISGANLDASNTRLIYSKSNKVRLSIPNGKPEDQAKKINLITSTAFEGCDILDEDGRTIIVSDSSKQHTLVDISTSLHQIAGRIRNSKYASEIWHLFSSTRYSNDLTYEEYSEVVKENIKVSHRRIDTYNAIIPEDRAVISVDSDSEYFVKKDNLFHFDPNRVKFDLYNFKITNHIYKTKVNLVTAYRANGLNCPTVYMDRSQVVIDTPEVGFNFEEVVNSVKVVWDDIYNLNKQSILSAAFTRYPFLQEAIEKLGFNGIEETGYVITNIKRKLVNADLSTSLNVKIMKRLKLESAIRKGEFVASSKLKEVLTLIYRELGIKKKVTAPQILDFYEASNKKKKVDGKPVDGFVIIREKFLFTDLL